MSSRRNVWATLARLLERLENDVDTLHESSVENGLTNLEKEVRKLGKTQFKANVLAEDQYERMEKALSAAQSSQDENTHLLETLADKRTAESQKNLLETVLPVLDGLDNAITSGQRYLKKRDLAAHKPNLSPAQAILVSPADRSMLTGWLDGLRVVRARLLAILEAGDVNPIPTVGLPFDPYLHIVVGTTSEDPAGMEPIPGIIVAEDRCGYQSPAGVLRYAEVIVYRSE